MNSYEQPNKTEIVKLSELLKDINQSSPSLFNQSLFTYLNQTQQNQQTLLELFQLLQQSNIYFTKSNKELLLKQFKNIYQKVGDQSQFITIGQYAMQMQITDQEIIQNYITFFLECDITKLKNIQLFDLLFLIVLVIKRNSISSEQRFIDQWNNVILNLEQNLEDNEKYIYLKKYPHLMYILKTLITEDYSPKLWENYNAFFSKVTIQFIKQTSFEEYSSKDLTILLLSAVRINESKQVYQIDLHTVIDMTLKNIQKMNLQSFNDHSINSLVLSLTFLQKYQLQFIEPIMQIIIQRIQEQQMHGKFHLAILFEIYFKWTNKINVKYLIQFIQKAQVKDFSDFDLAQYFQLLTLLNGDIIDKHIVNIENELIERTKKFKDKDNISTQRLKKSIVKILQKISFNSKSIPIFVRISQDL